MKPFLTIRRALTVAALAATWCGLWRDISVANVAVGTVLAVLVTGSGVGTPLRGGIQLGPLGRLIWLVAVDLVKSTASVAKEILTPTDYTEEAIVAVQLPAMGRDHLLLLIVAITLTPGTAVVDVDPSTTTLYLHLLHHDRRDATIGHAQELADLACAALPTTRIGAPS